MASDDADVIDSDLDSLYAEDHEPGLAHREHDSKDAKLANPTPPNPTSNPVDLGGDGPGCKRQLLKLFLNQRLFRLLLAQMEASNVPAAASTTRTLGSKAQVASPTDTRRAVSASDSPSDSQPFDVENPSLDLVQDQEHPSESSLATPLAAGPSGPSRVQLWQRLEKTHTHLQATYAYYSSVSTPSTSLLPECSNYFHACSYTAR